MSRPALQTIVARYESLATQFLQLAMRERLIVAIGLLAIIYGLWDFTVYAGAMANKERLQAQLMSLNKEHALVNAEEQVLIQALANDPLAVKKREVAVLEKQIKALDESLEALSVGLIPPRELPQVLHDMLDSSQQLDVLSLMTRRPQKLELMHTPAGSSTAHENEVENSEPKIKQITVCKHAVEVRLKGDYFAVLDYLNLLENMSWKLYWETLDYQVDAYPLAEVMIKVYTLSLESGEYP